MRRSPPLRLCTSVSVGLLFTVGSFACKKTAPPTALTLPAEVNDSDGDHLGDFAWTEPNGAVRVRQSTQAPPSPGWSWRVADPTLSFVSQLAFLGDLNGDRVAEFAVVEQSLSQETCAPGKVHVFSGSRAGLDRAPMFAVGSLDPQHISLPDAAVPGRLHFARTGHLIHRVASGDARWIIGVTQELEAPPAGRMTSRTTPPPALSTQQRVAFCGQDELWLYQGVQLKQRIAIETGAVTAVATGDLDGDGLTDLAVLVPPQIELYRGTRDGFESQPSHRMHDPHDDRQRVSGLAIDDINGDSQGELIVTFEYSPSHDGFARVGAVHFEPLSDHVQTRTLVIQSQSAQGEGRSVIVLRPRLSALSLQRRAVVVADPETNSLYVYDRFAQAEQLLPTAVLRSPIGTEQFGTAITALSANGPLAVRGVNAQTGGVQLWQISLQNTAPRELVPTQLLGEHPMAIAARDNQITSQRAVMAASMRSFGGCDVATPREQVVIEDSRPDALQRAIILALNTQSDLLDKIAECHRVALRQNCEYESRLQLTLTGNVANRPILRGIAWIGSSRPDERQCVSTLVGREILATQHLDESTSLTLTLLRGRAQH